MRSQTLRRKQSRTGVGATVLFSLVLVGPAHAQQAPAAAPPPSVSRQQAATAAVQTYPPELVKNGNDVFQQNCAFCHGRDAAGGETGPDLTRSKLVADDVKGNKIADVIRNGRPDKGMPRFNLTEVDMAAVVAFIHDQKTKQESQQGGRKGVDPADLQTGNAEAGKRYFNGAGGCNKCHSPTSDLNGVASRLIGLKLVQRLMYPRDAKATAKITLPDGSTAAGTLAYQDEFVIGIKDADGRYRSWPVSAVKYSVDAPAEAHAELLHKYTDDDIHNLMAYLQTLK